MHEPEPPKGEKGKLDGVGSREKWIIGFDRRIVRHGLEKGMWDRGKASRSVCHGNKTPRKVELVSRFHFRESDFVDICTYLTEMHRMC